MENKSLLSSILGQLSLSGIFATLITLLCYNNEMGNTSFMYILMILGPVSSLINAIFMLKEKSLSMIVAFNAVLFAVAEFLIIYLKNFMALGVGIGSSIATIVLVSMGAYVIIKPPKHMLVIKFFDFSIALTLFFLFIISVKGFSLALIIPGIISALAALIGTISFRMNRKTQFRDWALMLVILIIIAALACLLFFFAANPLGNGILGAWNGMISALGTALKAIGRFFTWFFSLFGSEELPPVDIEMEAPVGSLGGGVEEEAAVDGSGYILLFIVIGIVALFIVMFFFFRRNKYKTKRKSLTAATKIVRERKGLNFGIRKLFEKIKGKIRARQFLKKNKNTAIGLFYLMVKALKNTPYAMRIGDTPKEFLEKIETVDEYKDNMKELVNEINLLLYAKNHAANELKWADSFRKAIKKKILFIEKQ